VNGVRPEEVVLAASLASRAENQDPIDPAVLSGLKDTHALDSYQIVHFQPFDSVHKRTESTVEGPEKIQFRVTKGAPQVILDMAADAGEVPGEVENAVNEFAARGFRSLGVARTDE